MFEHLFIEITIAALPKVTNSIRIMSSDLHVTQYIVNILKGEWEGLDGQVETRTYIWLIHTNKCTKTSYVINSFIKRLPQYAFQHFYIAIIRGIVEVCTYTNVLKFLCSFMFFNKGINDKTCLCAFVGVN
jgi:hypothetical protein